MKKQTAITKILTHAIAAVIATAAMSSTAAAGTLAIPEDFNNDGLLDMAVVTSATTITVSLANGFGGYTVSAILTTPKNQQITQINAYDWDGDGDPDVIANLGSGTWYYTWMGNGDGTFGSGTTRKYSKRFADGF